MSELAIDCEVVSTIICGFIREEVRKAGFEKVVVGLSGGVDSTTSAYLAVRALGAENVFALMMPYKTSSPESLRDALDAVEKVHIPYKIIEITPMVEPYFEMLPDIDRLRRGNKMARERMTILFDHSMALSALVLGTSNKTELLLGYGTLYGDLASSLNPIGDLYKTQVWQLAECLGVPERIRKKAPSADLWVGQTDEEELGFSYAEVDRLLFYMVDKHYTAEELRALGFDRDFINNIRKRIASTQYKRRLPLIAKVSQRTIDWDFRYLRDWGR